MTEAHVFFVSLQKRGKTYKLVCRESSEGTARAVYLSQVWHVAFGGLFDYVSLEKVTYAAGVPVGREVVEFYGLPA